MFGFASISTPPNKNTNKTQVDTRRTSGEHILFENNLYTKEAFFPMQFCYTFDATTGRPSSVFEAA